MVNLIENLFIWSMNQSLSIILLILAVVLVRALFRRVPKRILCALWIVVFLRLLAADLFFNFPGLNGIVLNPFHRETFYQEQVAYGNEEIGVLRMNSGLENLDNRFNSAVDTYYDNNVISNRESENNEAAVSKETNVPYMGYVGHTTFRIVSFIWMIGVSMFLLYSIVWVFYLKKKLATAICITKGKTVRIYESDQIKGPFLFGFFRPAIYLPVSLSEGRDLVLLHERIHLKRRDYLVKPFLFVITCFYWYHPLVWLSFYLFSRDVEMAVDEEVCRLNGNDRTDYAKMLLKISVKQSGLYLPLAFAESDTKKRVKHVLAFSRGGKWLTGAAIMVMAAVFICFGSVRGQEQGEETNENPMVEDAENANSDNENIGDSNINTNEAEIGENTDFGDQSGENQSDTTRFMPNFTEFDELGRENIFVIIYDISKSSHVIDRYEASDAFDLELMDVLSGYPELPLSMDCTFFLLTDKGILEETDFDKFSSLVNEYSSIGVRCSLKWENGLIVSVEAQEDFDFIRQIAEDKENYPQITYYEDLTHDGVDERIVVDPYFAVTMPRTASEKIVQVYDGRTDQLIWWGHVDWVHGGWGGFYIYRDEKGLLGEAGSAYLLDYEPEIWQGAGYYECRIFSLTETGAEEIVVWENVGIDLNQPETCDMNAIMEFAEKMNAYFEDCYVLIDTNDGLNLYSTDGSKIACPYDGTELPKLVNETLQEMGIG